MTHWADQSVEERVKTAIFGREKRIERLYELKPHDMEQQIESLLDTILVLKGILYKSEGIGWGK